MTVMLSQEGWGIPRYAKNNTEKGYLIIEAIVLKDRFANCFIYNRCSRNVLVGLRVAVVRKSNVS